MSHFGEHALGWVAVAGVGAALDKPRRRRWAGVAVGALGAHAASIVIKRVVRRPRPNDPSVQVNVSTPSKLSFPSSHATSTTAAAVLLGRLTGLPLPAVLIPPMLLSRLVLGVHYPTDVLAGSALGAVSAAAVLRAEQKFGVK
ncbi:phosphatase PAP2 family protein [Rhodococcus hoagii]|nr:phosphatase PAP2 family protein [Prescottella equi]